jgi:uncharacterized membrane protein
LRVKSDRNCQLGFGSQSAWILFHEAFDLAKNITRKNLIAAVVIVTAIVSINSFLNVVEKIHSIEDCDV